MDRNCIAATTQFPLAHPSMKCHITMPRSSCLNRYNRGIMSVAFSRGLLSSGGRRLISMLLSSLSPSPSPPRDVGVVNVRGNPLADIHNDSNPSTRKRQRRGRQMGGKSSSGGDDVIVGTGGSGGSNAVTNQGGGAWQRRRHARG
jgi:hypothetical protein